MTAPKVPLALDRGGVSPAERQALFSALLVVLWAMKRAGMIGDSVRLTDSPPPPFGEGAKGPLVAIWQKAVGAAPDGDFGPKTKALTRAWSERAGFGPREKVEPAMWVTAVGLTFAVRPDGVILPSGEAVGCPAVSADVAQILGGSSL